MEHTDFHEGENPTYDGLNRAFSDEGIGYLREQADRFGSPEQYLRELGQKLQASTNAVVFTDYVACVREGYAQADKSDSWAVADVYFKKGMLIGLGLTRHFMPDTAQMRMITIAGEYVGSIKASIAEQDRGTESTKANLAQALVHRSDVVYKDVDKYMAAHGTSLEELVDSWADSLGATDVMEQNMVKSGLGCILNFMVRGWRQYVNNTMPQYAKEADTVSRMSTPEFNQQFYNSQLADSD